MNYKKYLFFILCFSSMQSMELPSSCDNFPTSEEDDGLDFKALEEELNALQDSSDNEKNNEGKNNLYLTLKTIFLNLKNQHAITPIQIANKHYFVSRPGHLHCLKNILDFLSQWAEKDIPRNCVEQYEDMYVMEVKPTFVAPAFQNVLERSNHHRGPNCYNTALIASKFFTSDQFRYMHPEEFLYYIDNYFHRVDSPEPGDIVLCYEPNPLSIQKFPYRAGYYLGDQILFNKLSHQSKNFTFNHIKNLNLVTFYRKNTECHFQENPLQRKIKTIETHYSNWFTKRIRTGRILYRKALKKIESQSICEDNLQAYLVTQSLLQSDYYFQEFIKTLKDNK